MRKIITATPQSITDHETGTLKQYRNFCFSKDGLKGERSAPTNKKYTKDRHFIKEENQMTCAHTHTDADTHTHAFTHIYIDTHSHTYI